MQKKMIDGTTSNEKTKMTVGGVTPGESAINCSQRLLPPPLCRSRLSAPNLYNNMKTSCFRCFERWKNNNRNQIANGRRWCSTTITSFINS